MKENGSNLRSNNKHPYLNDLRCNRLRRLIDSELARENISSIKLAQRCNIDKSQMNRHYNGEALPSINDIVKYATYFKVSSDYLLGLEIDDSDSESSLEDWFIENSSRYVNLSRGAIALLNGPDGKVISPMLDYVINNLDINSDLPDLIRLCNKEQKHIASYLKTVEVETSNLKISEEAYVSDLFSGSNANCDNTFAEYSSLSSAFKSKTLNYESHVLQLSEEIKKIVQGKYLDYNYVHKKQNISKSLQDIGNGLHLTADVLEE